ncbi:Mitochondrial pyruvate carrier [Lachancea thermotolerans]|uniref:Mitochondrial pyruvate carrier n=1 Tax=Lachancea thermotolerans (strain ATCC 56472 / CBS 6340 / NRRL Y-8284) TaxID=559295 RepID=C5E1Z4_LACTC|nr:KLTH0H00858p [Lachancea thermotolerans CBS 6340]CAR30055.1 KLTH0H00858p [Lachancea thermotolerans CBS 6340]
MSAAGAAFRRFLNSETGPKTVHFWAPTLKWALVFAGISDVSRPVDKLSGVQNLSLLATGVIWTRWSFVIKPKNMLLASVNFFLACTAGYQLTRICNYRRAQGDTPGQVANYVINGPPPTHLPSERQHALTRQPSPAT